MSLRSALLPALLLVAFAAAQVNMIDQFLSYWSNSSDLLKLCAVDAPSRCYYVPKVDNVDTSKILVIITYKCGTSTCAITNPVGDYYMLRYVSVADRPWYVVEIPRSGLLYSTSSFSIGPPGSSVKPSTSYTVCGKTYPYAYYVPMAGSYNITPFRPPYYIVDLSTCREYRIAAYTSQVVNITNLWYSLYLATIYPNVYKIYSANRGYALNGTLHAYLTYFHAFLAPPGQGFYILGPYVSPTLVMPKYYGGSGFYSFRGPVAYDVWSNYRLAGGAPGEMYIHYNIGWPPGDGFFMAVLPATAQGLVELAYIADNSTGYFMMRPIGTSGGGYATFHRRFDIVHVAVKDALYVYDTRGAACPIAYYNVGWALNRLDRAYEIEICNNNTYAAYVVLFYGTVGSVIPPIIPSIILPGFHLYMYGDRVEPGSCARLRWDSAISAKPYLRVYTTPQDVCNNNNYVLSTTSYNPSWRYNLIGNSLVPVGPISPDYNYAPQWLELLEWLSQLYRNLQGNFTRYLNATRGTNATALNLTDFYASMPQFLGTIKMESATSTWLRTTLNELQKWKVVGPVVGGTVSVSIQAPSPLAASAAAAAVATAWAASRRSLATAAFLAGFAILATALFVVALYGAIITAALVMAAVILMSIGAAAAWQRQTGED